MPVPRILINTHRSLNRVIIISILDQAGIHQFIGMLINDCTVTVKEIHRILSFVFDHLYRFFYIILNPGGRNAIYQRHGQKKHYN